MNTLSQTKLPTLKQKLSAQYNDIISNFCEQKQKQRYYYYYQPFYLLVYNIIDEIGIIKADQEFRA